MIGRALRMAAGVVGMTLDLFVRYVPDVEPIVFDRDRALTWRRMVEAADVWRAPSEVTPR